MGPRIGTPPSSHHLPQAPPLSLCLGSWYRKSIPNPTFTGAARPCSVSASQGRALRHPRGGTPRPTCVWTLVCPLLCRWSCCPLSITHTVATLYLGTGPRAAVTATNWGWKTPKTSPCASEARGPERGGTVPLRVPQGGLPPPASSTLPVPGGPWLIDLSHQALARAMRPSLCIQCVL